MATKTKSKLADSLKEINKTLKGEALKMMSEDLLSDVSIWIPTGVPTLDVALGGGLPVGRVVEVFGKQQTGKSTLAISACIEAQRAGGLVVYVDAEEALSKDRAAFLGLDMNNAVVLEPSTMEEAYKYLDHLLAHFGASEEYPFILIVWDTIAFTPSAAEMDDNGEIKADMGKRAQNIRRIMRKMIKMCARSKACFLSLNHVTEKIGGFVNPGAYETPGGTAFKFGASLQILMKSDNSKKIFSEEDEKQQVGNHVKFKIEKTRLSPPKREVTARLNYYYGFDKAGTVLDYLIENKLASKEGTKYNVPVPASTEAVQISTGEAGDKKFHELWESNPDLRDHISSVVKTHYDAIIPWKSSTVTSNT
jgi:recombination protein RecA